MDQNKLYNYSTDAGSLVASEGLSENERQTLNNIFDASLSYNTRKALVSDLRYLSLWYAAVCDRPLEWPADKDTVYAFIAHHMFVDDDAPGMPETVEKSLRASRVLKGNLPVAPSSFRRRINSWVKVHRLKQIVFPDDKGRIKIMIDAACNASGRLVERKSALPVTREVLDVTLSKIGRFTARDLRDRAMLSLAYASGGRRRSEIAGLMIDDLEIVENKAARILIRKSKGRTVSDAFKVAVKGKAFKMLKEWIEFLRKEEVTDKGPLFRAIDMWGNLAADHIDGSTVNAVLKRRLEAAGFDSEKYSAHGLRAGFMTDARLKGVPLEAAMARSGHRAAEAARRYYQEVDVLGGPGADLLD